MKIHRAFPLLALAFVAMAALATPCHAQDVFDTVLTKYNAATSLWANAFLTRANWLFWTLALIELTWVGITLAMRQADIQEIVGDLVRFIFITGFFFALLQNGTTWIPAIVQSFRDAGNAANTAAGGTSNLNPSGIMDIALNVAANVCDSGSWWNPGSKVFVGLMGIAVLICGALIAMMLTVAIVEMYVVTTCGLLVLGFGGSRWTRDYATKMISYAVGTGVKLMIMQLLIGLGEIFLNDFATKFNGLGNTFNVGDVAPVLVSLIVLAGLVRAIPNLAQSLISGTHIHTGGGFGAAVGVSAQTMQAAKAVTAVASGGTGAIVAAASLAGAQGAGSSRAGAAGSGGGSIAMGLGASLARGASFAGRVAGNLAKSGAKDIQSGMRGDHKQPNTNMAQRMTGAMAKQAEAIKGKEDKKS